VDGSKILSQTSWPTDTYYQRVSFTTTFKSQIFPKVMPDETAWKTIRSRQIERWTMC